MTVDVFEEVQTVRFQHCDPAGIVFCPRDYEMLNLTVERFFERKHGPSFDRFTPHFRSPSARRGSRPIFRGRAALRTGSSSR